jgi:hypothetical protein
MNNLEVGVRTFLGAMRMLPSRAVHPVTHQEALRIYTAT